MTPTNRDELDEAIIRAIRNWKRQPTTYVIRNIVSEARAYRGVRTDLILRRLKRMEKSGIVERAPSTYAVMLCWREASPFTPKEES